MSTMELLVYASDMFQRERLLGAIKCCSHQWHVETFKDFRAFNRRLKNFCTGEMWLVMVTSDLAELCRMTTVCEIIRSRRSILVLPDHRRETVRVGHTLYPRFISYIDSDFSDVSSVLSTVSRKAMAKRN